jgi:hypothetical protein
MAFPPQAGQLSLIKSSNGAQLHQGSNNQSANDMNSSAGRGMIGWTMGIRLHTRQTLANPAFSS